MTTPESARVALVERIRAGNRARWAKRKWRSKEARSAFAAYVSSHILERTAGGRPRSPDRCSCGLYTKTYAERRRHHCEAGRVRVGRPRSPDRCPCGLYTKAYAERRRHHCEADRVRVGKSTS